MATAVLSIDIEARIANLEAGFQRASKLAKDFGSGMAAGSTTATAAGEKLLASVKDQIATFGLAGTQLQMYRAGQEGVAQQATLLTRVLDGLGNAEKRKAEIQQVAIAADRERGAASQQFANAQQQMVASLQREIDVFGKTAAEVRLMDAALLGAAERVGPLAAALERLQNEAKGAGATRAFVAALQSEVAALESEAAAAGKSSSELRLLAAAQVGAAQAAGPLIARIEELRNAEAAAATEAAKMASARKDADSANISRQKFIEELRRETEEIGKNRIELLQLKAARLDAAAAEGTGRHVAAGDETGALIAQIKRLEKAEHDAAKTAALLAQQEKLAADELVNAANKRNRFIESVTNEAGAIGKLRSELLTLQAAELGVSAQMAPMIEKLRALETVGGGQFGGMANNARKAGLQMQQVGYQLNDFFVQIASGQNPMIAFIQQGSQLSGTFGGIGAAFRGVTALITPMVLGVGTAAAVVGTLGLAWYKGMQESQAFGKALLLTGNYAGLTEDRFNAMSKSIAASATVSMGEARAALSGFVATGQFTGKSLSKMSEAAALFAVANSKSTDEVVKDFATMSGGVTKWATEHNKQLNLLDPAQLKYIRRLEEMGEAEKAELVIAEAVIARFKDQAENLGYLEAGWGNLSRGAKRAWDAMLDIGRSATPEDKITALQKRIADRLKPVAEGSDIQSVSRPDFATGSAKEKARANAEDERQLAIELAKKADADAAAKAASDKARGNKAINEANEFYDKYKSQTKKAAEEMAQVNAKFARATELNPNLDKAAYAELLKKRDDAIAEIKSRNKGPKGAAIQRDDPTKALLANQLKDLEHQAGEEREILSEKNRTLDLLYGEHLISIKDYYQDRKTAANVALNAQIDDYDKEIAALEAYKAKAGKATDQAEAQGKINDLIDKKRKLTAAAAYEGTVAAFKEKNAYRDLEDQINDVNGALQRLTGNKTEGSGAAFDKQYRAYKEKLEAGKNTGALENLAALRSETVAQGEMNDEIADAALIYEKLRNTEESIAISRQLGVTSELGSLALLGDARQESVRQLESILLAQEAIARISENPKLLLEAQRARLEFEKLAASADVLGDKFRTLFADNVSGPLTDFIDGTKTAKEAFTSFAKSITHELNSMASKSIADMLFGKKGAIGGVGEWIGKLFGGGKAEAGAGAEGAGLAGVGNDLFSAFAGTGAGASPSGDIFSTLLGGLTGGQKGDAPSNPMYVKSVDLLAMAGGAGLSSVIPGTSGGGGGGLIDAGIKIASSYFGSTGGATGATSFAGGADSVAAENFFSMFAEAAAGAATGGETTPGWFMAGEEGRELIRTKGGARVYNNRDTEKMLGASAQKPSETVVNHNYNITVSPPEGADRRTALQWGESVGQQIRGSGRNS